MWLRALTTTAIAIAWTSAARADDEPLRLTWIAPPGCPSGDDVRAATLRGLGGTKIVERVTADARVELQNDTWRVTLTTRGAERVIEGPTCAGVADATAVVLALALVPPGRAPVPPAPSASSSSPPPAPSAVLLPSRPPPAPPSAPGAHRLAAGISGAAEIGSLPKPALGGALGVAWTPGRLRIEAEGRLLAAQSQAVADTATGARFSFAAVGARGCYAIVRELGSFDLAPCAGGDLAFVTANGFGADTNLQPSTSWATLAAGGLGRVFLGSAFALRARLDAFVPLSRPRFLVQGRGEVHRTPTVGAATYFGAEVLFLNGWPWLLPLSWRGP